jgi:glycerate 2-kinase
MLDKRKDLKEIYTAGIEAVDPKKALLKHLSVADSSLSLIRNGKVTEFNLKNYEHIYIVGAGKATSPMAEAVEDLLLDDITEGVISVKYGYTLPLKYIETMEGAHPVPDENGRKSAKRILSLLEKAQEKDLVISLISGGGSSLLPLPPKGISLEEKQITTDQLLRCGASIHEINCVRKHLSQIKGGQLASAAFPATVINLMISDVVGDDMNVISSGPLVPDPSTFQEARDILEKYSLATSIPSSVSHHLTQGASGNIAETPASDDIVFKMVYNSIIASNILSCKAAGKKAEELGYNSIVLSSMIQGDTADAARWHSEIAKEVCASGNPVRKPACIISGGETTVNVTGNGKGGRNMEFAMEEAWLIQENPSILIASVGTDGSDGPTDAAGALADGTTLSRAEALSLDSLAYKNNNDSYTFFKQLNDLIVTGPTNTNVMDLRIILID